MSAVAIQFLDQGLHRVIFDAMPMPVFVVDQDVSILEYNTAAAALLGADRRKVVPRKSGDVLQCIHSGENAKGCGHSRSCCDCVVRRSVQSAVQGVEVRRERAQLELMTGGKRTRVDVRVSSRPLQYEKHSYVLLILEGLEEATLNRVPARRSTRKC
jgi:PAS domain-containing protein